MRTVIIFLFFHQIATFRCCAQEDYVQNDSVSFALKQNDCGKLEQGSVKRIVRLTERVRKANDTFLHEFLEKESELLHSLCAINEVSAEALMQDAWYSFNRFENLSKRDAKAQPNGYLPEIDTLSRAFDFIESKGMGDSSSKVCNCNGFSEFRKVNQKLKEELKRTELISNYIRERRGFLVNTLSDVPGSGGLMKGITQTSYYFQSQIKENVSLFNDRSAIEKMILGKLSIHGPFNEFMSLHGQLTLPPAVNGGPPELTFTELLKQAPDKTKTVLASMTTDPSGVLSKATSEVAEIKTGLEEKVEPALSETQIIRDEIDSAENAVSEVDSVQNSFNEKKEDLSGQWKPNPLKTKRVIDRFNWGCSFQADKRTYLYPLSGTFSLQLSYLIHKNSSVGIGSALIVGFDRFRSNTAEQLPVLNSLSANGLNLRSFIDCRLKGAFYLQGGYERNYRNKIQILDSGLTSEFRFRESANSSCLVGLKIKYPSSNKKSRPTTEFLYDFLAHKTGQPAFVFRFGIEFNRKHGIK